MNNRSCWHCKMDDEPCQSGLCFWCEELHTLREELAGKPLPKLSITEIWEVEKLL